MDINVHISTPNTLGGCLVQLDCYSDQVFLCLTNTAPHVPRQIAGALRLPSPLRKVGAASASLWRSSCFHSSTRVVQQSLVRRAIRHGPGITLGLLYGAGLTLRINNCPSGDLWLAYDNNSWWRPCQASYCCRLPSFLDLFTFIFSSHPSFFRFRFGCRFLSSCFYLVGVMLSPQFLMRFVQRTIIIQYDNAHLIRT